MSEKKRQQASREFGVKLARAVGMRAADAAKHDDLDARFVMLGAAEYLKEKAELQLDPPLDSTQTGAAKRRN